MFVRKKNNPSGIVSVQVVGKINRKNKVYKTIGSSRDATVVEDLCCQGKKWIVEKTGERDMFLEQIRNNEEQVVVSGLLNKIENILLNGTQLILNPVYKKIGFSAVNDDILRHLVVMLLTAKKV
jgi:hypothetical protein